MIKSQHPFSTTTSRATMCLFGKKITTHNYICIHVYLYIYNIADFGHATGTFASTIKTNLFGTDAATLV